jgi:hypothetical protein
MRPPYLLLDIDGVLIPFPDAEARPRPPTPATTSSPPAAAPTTRSPSGSTPTTAACSWT